MRIAYLGLFDLASHGFLQVVLLFLHPLLVLMGLLQPVGQGIRSIRLIHKHRGLLSCTRRDHPA